MRNEPDIKGVNDPASDMHRADVNLGYSYLNPIEEAEQSIDYVNDPVNRSLDNAGYRVPYRSRYLEQPFPGIGKELDDPAQGFRYRCPRCLEEGPYLVPIENDEGRDSSYRNSERGKGIS